MGIITVDVNVLINDKWKRMFHNVKLEVDEASNHKMNEAFETQHPRLLKRIPTHTDKRGFTFRCAFFCRPHWET